MNYDFSNLADDKTVLANPHKGWYYHYVDNGFQSAKYRDRLPEGNPFSDFPGMHHLYLRFDWVDVEKEEGKIDFSEIESIIARYRPYGLRFALRLCTYEGSFEATPLWVYEKGAKSIVCPPGKADGVHEPVYCDPVYLRYLERLMQAYGAQFDGREEIEFVDVGTFGTWGEGHTWFGSRTVYDPETLRTHLSLHLRYFKKTRLLVNDDMIKEAEKTSPAAAAELLDLCRFAGVGIRDDSVSVDTYAKECGYDTLSRPAYFDEIGTRAPVDLECQHCRETAPEYTGDGFRILEALRRGHASYCGFHGYLSEWMPKMRYFTEYAANRMGYWYFVRGLECGTLFSGRENEIVLELENRGYAPAYHPYVLRIALIDEEGTAHPVSFATPDLRELMGESRRRFALTLGVPALAPGDYRFAVGIFEGDAPLSLALRAECRRADGLYELTAVRVAAV